MNIRLSLLLLVSIIAIILTFIFIRPIFIELPAITPFDIIMIILIYFAIDTLTPWWPTTEIIILIPLERFFGIDFIKGEIIAQIMAVLILVIASLYYGPLVWMPVKIIFGNFISDPFLMSMTVAFAISFLLIAYHWKSD